MIEIQSPHSFINYDYLLLFWWLIKAGSDRKRWEMRNEKNSRYNFTISFLIYHQLRIAEFHHVFAIFIKLFWWVAAQNTSLRDYLIKSLLKYVFFVVVVVARRIIIIFRSQVAICSASSRWINLFTHIRSTDCLTNCGFSGCSIMDLLWNVPMKSCQMKYQISTSFPGDITH